MHNFGVICFNNLTKLQLSLSQSLLTQEFLKYGIGGMGFVKQLEQLDNN